MDFKKNLQKYWPVILVIILVLLSFFIRADAANINAAGDQKDYYINNDTGMPYFSEMDSYYNYRLTNNYLTTGNFGDAMVNGTIPWDYHSYAPEGRSAAYPPLISYVTIAFYYIANLFSNNVILMNVAFWTSAIIASLATIPAFYFVRKLTNSYGGFVAGLLVGLSPNFLSHSYAGFFDTDMFVLLLGCLVVLFFIESLYSKKFPHKILFAVLSSVSMLLFSLAWTGYIYYFAILLIVIVVYLILAFYTKIDVIEPIKNYKTKLEWIKNQNILLTTLIFIVLTIVLVDLFNGFLTTFNGLLGLVGATTIQELATVAGSYPNVYVTVSELQVPSVLSNGVLGLFQANTNSLVNGVGGTLGLLAGFAMLFIYGKSVYDYIRTGAKKVADKIPNKRSKKNKKGAKGTRKSTAERQTAAEISITKKVKTTYTGLSDIKTTLFFLVLFLVWIGVSLYTITKGTRFIATLALPLSLAAGLFIGYISEYILASDINLKQASAICFVFGAVIGISAVSYFLNHIGVAIVGIIAGVIGIGLARYQGSPDIKKKITVIFMVFAVVTPCVAYGVVLDYSTLPGTNDGMWDSMKWVGENATADAVVSSWWDYGHMFIVASNHSVTFDGGSQNSPRAYWVAKAFTTNDTDLSAAIFTMLATSGDKAYDTLDTYTQNKGTSVDILLNTLPLDSDAAKTMMVSKYNLTESQANTIIQYSHPTNPKPVVVVASVDMISKANAWTYFAGWDFTKGDTPDENIYSYLVSEQTFRPNNYTTQTYNGQWNMTSYIGATVIDKSGAINSTSITMDQFNSYAGNVNASITLFDLSTGKNTSIVPHKLTIVKDGFVLKEEILNETGEHSLYVFGTGTEPYQTIVMDSELDEAVFTKLYLLPDTSNSKFKLAYQNSGVMLWTLNS